MEYARIRHTLGSFCFHRMIRVMGSMDYMPLKSVDVRLECKNLLPILKYPDDVHIVFFFDKVFDPELLIHIVLVVINSPHVKYFMTCRDSFTTQQHPYHLKGTRFVFEI